MNLFLRFDLQHKNMWPHKESYSIHTKYANNYQKTEYTEGPCIFFSIHAGFHLVSYNISVQHLHYINIQVGPPLKRKQATKYPFYYDDNKCSDY